MRSLQGVLSTLILITASALGVVAFLSPFFSGTRELGTEGFAHAQEAPFLFLALTVLALGAILADLSAGAVSVQAVALLAALSAVGAVLRWVPGPGGFSALFVVPILGGYVFGPRFGFLLGVFTLAISAFITGGVGPWMPFQMFATGWVGLLSGLWARLVVGRGTEPLQPSRWEVGALAAWGAFLGLFYGMVMNLWFWPFVFQAQQPELYWEPGLSWRATVTRYAAFYLTTSLWWDLGRAGGNALLLLAMGRPVLRALRRFQSRMMISVLPEDSLAHSFHPGDTGGKPVPSGEGPG